MFFFNSSNSESEYLPEISDCLHDLGKIENPYCRNNISALVYLQERQTNYENVKVTHNLYRRCGKTPLNRGPRRKNRKNRFNIINSQKTSEEEFEGTKLEEFRNFIVNIRPDLIDFLISSYMKIFNSEIPYEALFLSINLMDRYYGRIYLNYQQPEYQKLDDDIGNKINIESDDKLYMSYYSNHSFMLVCIGALSLATKYYYSSNDSSAELNKSNHSKFSIDTLRILSNFSYTNDQIIRMELDLLIFLEGKIGHFISVGESVDLFLSKEDNNTTESEHIIIKELSIFICILCQYNIDMLMVNSLELSYSCLMISKYILHPKKYAEEVRGKIIVENIIKFLVLNGQENVIPFTQQETSYHIAIQAHLFESFSRKNILFSLLIGGNFTKKLSSLCILKERL